MRWMPGVSMALAALLARRTPLARSTLEADRKAFVALMRHYARYFSPTIGRAAIGWSVFGIDATGYSNFPLGAPKLDQATIDLFARAYRLFRPMQLASKAISREWVFERWNGDQTGYGLNFTDTPQALKVKLATWP